jgi:two-component system sensor histidine kinase UhpB
MTRFSAIRPFSDRYIPLFWRLLIPNASVLAAACVVLIIEPANGRVIALVGGLLIMLVINAVLMRRTFAPLARLMSLMDSIDPLSPGRRLPALRPQSEVTAVAQTFNDMLDRVETERRESAHRVLVDQEAERRLLASELHDQIGQDFTALIMQIERLAKRVPEECQPLAHDAVATARGSLEDVRGLARRLRPEVLDELGLAPALANLCDRLSHRTGLPILRDISSDLSSVEEDAQLVIYRVAQESLTNVVRHAGAQRAEVKLTEENGHLELCVLDDGIGFPADMSSNGGIRGMRERAVLVGGQLTLAQSSLGGALVCLRLPHSSG